MTVIATEIAVKRSTSGRAARVHSGAIPYRGKYRGTMLMSPAMALAPANQRIRIVMRSYAVPNHSPRSPWARNASARPFALPPGLNSSAGMRSVVTRLLATRNRLIVTAAVTRSFRVLRIRPSGFDSVSVGAPWTSGMTATPVSNPERPSASFGNTRIATAAIAHGLPCAAQRFCCHSATRCGRAATWENAHPTTTAFRAR